MAGKPEFAEFVAALSADDAELQRDLKAAEALTRKSASQMQGSLDTMKISAGNLSGVMGTLSQVGASVGGSFGGIVGQGVAAAQAMAGMTAVVSGPVGLVAALVALTVGVFAYREEAANWLNSMLQSIGILEDLDAALAKVEGRNAIQTSMLEKQRASQKRLNAELEQAIRLKTAQTTKNPEFIADTQRQIALEKRIAQELAAGGSQKSVDIIEAIARVNKRTEDSKRKQLEFDKMRAELQRQELEQARRIDQLTTSRIAGARGLLVQIGAANPSDFIDDPVLKRLARLGELLAERRQAAAGARPGGGRSGSFGLSRVQSPLAVVRGGEVIGRQQLTIQEQQKQIAADHRDIAAKIFTILDGFNRRSKTQRSGGNPLTVTDRA